MITNQNFYYINDDILDLRLKSSYQILSKYDDHEYYYLEFKRSLAKLGECLSHDNVLNRIVNGDLYLILCNSHEAFHQVVKEIYQRAVIELSIPEHKILLLSESADILTEVKQVALKLGKQDIKVKWTRMFEWSSNVFVNHIKRGIPYPKLIDKPFSKAFLNFNRRWRLHRPTLIALLFANNILDRGHVSFGPVEGETWDNIWWLIELQHNQEIKNLLLPRKDEIFKLPPLFLDTDDLEINKVEIEEAVEYLYSDSYFSVVSETNYYDDLPGRFLSEKIFKPVALEHPFVVLSRPNSLKLFRELGYKSFSPYIDETYDSIEDNSERLLAIVKEIKRLSYLNQNELSEFLKGLKEVCDYNYQVLVNKTNFITDLN